VIDLVPSRLELAKKHGATVVLNASEGDVVERVKEATGGLGVEFAVEASGVTSVLATAWASLANVRSLCSFSET
jgi:aryl-alcohol dehydrogenase